MSSGKVLVFTLLSMSVFMSIAESF